MVVVDSTYKYVLVDVGAEGRRSDGGVFKKSDFGQALHEEKLGIPALGQLPNAATAPYVFVGDEAFQLRKDFMRPFPGKQLQRRDERRIFNYRLSRARRCVENAFGITAARLRILLRTIPLRPKNVDFIIKAACILHNFLTVENTHSQAYMDSEDRFGNIVAGRWRQNLQGVQGNDAMQHFFPLESTHSRNFASDPAGVRNLFASYFCSAAGEVPWQWAQLGVSREKAMGSLQTQLLQPLHR
ncbi:uncharacterized protein LOC144172535 [Haemaphysalis longicornis]